MNSNKKILFISSLDLNKLAFDGVAKKLKLEIETFREFGYLVDYITMNESGVYINMHNDNVIGVCEWKGNFHKTYIELYKCLLKSEYYNMDIIYLRYEHISLAMLKFLKTFKNKSDRMVFAELPTYASKPYAEWTAINKLKFYIKDIINRILPKKIDYIVTFSDHKSIYSIPTISIENFADVKNLSLKKLSQYNPNKLNLLVLAHLSPAHGVDLVLKGIAKYCSDNKKEVDIFLNIVGDGPILEDLIKLSKNLNIDRNVKFHGSLGGEQLNNMFNESNIGIGAVAIFRKGSYKLSELKIREFTARGLPFIYNAYEPQIENQFFCEKIPFINDYIDMNNVITFYNKVYYQKDLQNRMRAFAENEFTAAKQLTTIHETIQNNLS